MSNSWLQSTNFAKPLHTSLYTPALLAGIPFHDSNPSSATSLKTMDVFKQRTPSATSPSCFRFSASRPTTLRKGK